MLMHRQFFPHTFLLEFDTISLLGISVHRSSHLFLLLYRGSVLAHFSSYDEVGFSLYRRPFLTVFSRMTRYALSPRFLICGRRWKNVRTLCKDHRASSCSLPRSSGEFPSLCYSRVNLSLVTFSWLLSVSNCWVYWLRESRILFTSFTLTRSLLRQIAYITVPNLPTGNFQIHRSIAQISCRLWMLAQPRGSTKSLTLVPLFFPLFN